MGQTYRIDRLNLITRKRRPQKVVNEARCRYLAKSQLSDVGFSNTGSADVGFSNTGFSNTGCS